MDYDSHDDTDVQGLVLPALTLKYFLATRLFTIAHPLASGSRGSTSRGSVKITHWQLGLDKESQKMGGNAIRGGLPALKGPNIKRI